MATITTALPRMNSWPMCRVCCVVVRIGRRRRHAALRDSRVGAGGCKGEASMPLKSAGLVCQLNLRVLLDDVQQHLQM